MRPVRPPTPPVVVVAAVGFTTPVTTVWPAWTPLMISVLELVESPMLTGVDCGEPFTMSCTVFAGLVPWMAVLGT